MERIGAEHATALTQCLRARYQEISRLHADRPTEQNWHDLLALLRLTDALGLDCEELYHGADAGAQTAPVGGKA